MAASENFYLFPKNSSNILTTCSLNFIFSLFFSIKWTRHIEEDDLLRFLKKEEVDLVLPLFEGAAESGKIKRKALKNWLVTSLFGFFIFFFGLKLLYYTARTNILCTSCDIRLAHRIISI